MAKGHGLNQRFFIGGRDLSGDVGAIQEAGSSRQFLETPVLNQEAMVRIRGRTDGRLVFNTWFDDAANLAHSGLSLLPTADVVVLWANRPTLSAVAAGILGKQVNYDWTRPADGSLLGTVEVVANGFPLEWLEMLTAGLITAVPTASQNNGAATSNGLIAYVESDNNKTVRIQDSADNAVWATLLDFAAAAGKTAERKTVAGTVRQYLRVTTSDGLLDGNGAAVAVRRGLALDD